MILSCLPKCDSLAQGILRLMLIWAVLWEVIPFFLRIFSQRMSKWGKYKKWGQSSKSSNQIIFKLIWPRWSFFIFCILKFTNSMYTTNESVKLKLSTSQYLGMKQLKVGTGLRQEVAIWDIISGMPLSRSRRSGTGAGTQNEILDWDRDSNSKFARSWTGSGTESWKTGTRSRDQEWSKKSRTGTGTHNQQIWDPGRGLGLKILKYEIRDRDPDLSDAGFRDSTGSRVDARLRLCPRGHKCHWSL